MPIKKTEQIKYTKDGFTLNQTEKFEYEKSIFGIGETYFRLESSDIKKLEKYQKDSESSEKENGKTISKTVTVLVGAPLKWLLDNGWVLPS